MTPLVIDDAMDRFSLCALEPPIPIKPTPFSFVWSFRLENDPGSRWFRTLEMRTYQELRQCVAEQASSRGLVKVRKQRK